jgi:hypothetical protein
MSYFVAYEEQADHDLLDRTEWTVVRAHRHGFAIGVDQRLQVERPEHAHSANENNFSTEVASGTDAATKSEGIVPFSKDLVTPRVILRGHVAFEAEHVRFRVVTRIVMHPEDVRHHNCALRYSVA